MMQLHAMHASCLTAQPTYLDLLARLRAGHGIRLVPGGGAAGAVQG